MTENKENIGPPRRKSSGRGQHRDQGRPGGGASADAEIDKDKGEATSAKGKSRRLAGIRPRISVEELRNAFKRQASVQQDDSESVFDPTKKAQESKNSVRGRTGVVYDKLMIEPLCLWDPNHEECPKRLLDTLQRCQELGLLDRCEHLTPRAAMKEEIFKVHTAAHLDILASTDKEDDAEKLETLSSKYDSLYFHPKTYETSLLAAGSTIELVDAVASGKVQNGMALIRPPGHHAMKSEFCGFCFLNNVAMAADLALEKHKLSRILIVDWDVHHGQATQQKFYEDPRVLYFSIHRYEFGTFWPNLPESDFYNIGSGPGRGFNFNVPLNKTGMKNEDYLAIFHQVLLPVAYEFDPEMIIVSSGYDATLGCLEGEMEVTPAFYSHLILSLMALAQGRVAVVLEGGYCRESLAEGAAQTLMTLLGDPSPVLFDRLNQPSLSIRESILNLIYVQRPYWKCFQYQGSFSVKEAAGEASQARHMPFISYLASVVKTDTYPTRDTCPIQPPETVAQIAKKLTRLKSERSRPSPKNKLCLAYDINMNKHRNLSEIEHPERPERIEAIWQRLHEYGIVDRAFVLQSRYAVVGELELIHTKEHIDLMHGVAKLGEKELAELQEKYKSIYIHTESNKAALLSVGSLLQVVDSVCSDKSASGIGVIRPPGHHAEPDRPHGFCLYNNVAIAAKYAIKQYGYQRVLILDWDVHHGNGIQHAFESDPHVMYMSIHRYDHGLFFPSSEDADYDRVGSGKGEGYNVNIPWNKSGMGDAEYMAAMFQVVLPVAYQYDPQLVIVSAGFDAARGDPLGGCRVSPECYGHMTHLLSGLSGGRCVLALEGGYSLTTISYCMSMCAKALLGDPLPMLEPALVPNKNAVQTINDVIKTHSRYWSSLCFQVDLPVEDILYQGFGGGPQAVESGLSGSEVSSCSSSPVFTPGSPPYISAPSSPVKVCTDASGTESAGIPMEIVNDSVNSCNSEEARESTPGTCAFTTIKAKSLRKNDSDEFTPKKNDEKPVSSADFTTPNTTPQKKIDSKGSRSSRSERSNCSERKMAERRSGSGTGSSSSISVRPRKTRNAIALQSAAASIGIVKSPTAIVSNEIYCGACCVELDQGPECIKAILQRCNELHLLETCIKLQPRPATEAEILAVHTNERLKNLPQGEKKCIHHSCAGGDILTAAGSCVQVVEEVLSNRAQNGMAIVQPAGHLSSNMEVIGKSCLNNAAIAAQVALDKFGLNRVLIVDWDSQHGLGLQRIFYDNPKVMVFSLHLHSDHSAQDSLCEKTGHGKGLGYNFNVNLDCHVVDMEDYLLIFHQLLLPVAYEYSPELVIISAGYELALHCEGLHPILYSHMTGLLMPLAQGKVVVVLEIGKCKTAIAEGVAATMAALQDKVCDPLPFPMSKVSPQVQSTVLDVMMKQLPNWKSLELHAQASCFYSNTTCRNSTTSSLYLPAMDISSIELKTLSSSVNIPEHTLCYVYDECMTEHVHYEDVTHPERPERISSIYKRLKEFDIPNRAHKIEARLASTSDLETVHSPKHINFMSSLKSRKPTELLNIQENYQSIYFHRRTDNAAQMAVGSLLAVVDSVMQGESRRGLAVIRPPGHHAERNHPCGYCYYNNVAIAAKHAIDNHGLQRVLILDWDVHHGNGIQHMFEADSRVLYISLHRYDNGKFFPMSTEANYNRIGIKKGKGYNVNIPWNKTKMGDGDYMAAMTEVVLPIAYQFNPQLVLVSAGFDAAVGDPLGGYLVTPECYGHMTRLLSCLAEGRVIVTLEGGYNVATISYCMTMCAKALLGDPLVPLKPGLVASKSALDTLKNVVATHRKYWPALNFQPGASIPASKSDMYEKGSKDTSSSSINSSALNSSTLDTSSQMVEDEISELADSLKQVNLKDSSKMASGEEGSRSEQVPNETTENMVEEEEGAVGGTSGPAADVNINTFLQTANPSVDQMFAVVPLSWCPHLEQVQPIPPRGMNTRSPCEECQDPSENWICLTCHKVLCGRFVNEHMLLHGVSNEHYMVLSFSDFSVWCYACDKYVHHSDLFDAKRAAHLDKFGEDIPQ